MAHFTDRQWVEAPDMEEVNCYRFFIDRPFAFKNCKVNDGLLNVLKKYTN
ncbi:hypothetical protein [Paenibacillus radicis (ex Xue et al. 2023)]|uniref:Uncharacterized protein n=1 Tax=Paenibacillus radicis (ex Xue et al. 2023) TaxID=2972489 RepID=A0ABT1YFY3_9BACL|nr:hypothetical protein [Paenibacillus radicis (ex Xue et al. 2023)]MCR8632104.1 hypothetical protein [Paenibacillus radicis (ex Xue et al. 2023)]